MKKTIIIIISTILSLIALFIVGSLITYVYLQVSKSDPLITFSGEQQANYGKVIRGLVFDKHICYNGETLYRIKYSNDVCGGELKFTDGIFVNAKGAKITEESYKVLFDFTKAATLNSATDEETALLTFIDMYDEPTYYATIDMIKNGEMYDYYRNGKLDSVYNFEIAHRHPATEITPPSDGYSKDEYCIIGAVLAMPVVVPYENNQCTINKTTCSVIFKNGYKFKDEFRTACQKIYTEQ